MLRGVRPALALAAVLAVAGQARAQFGYGAYPGGYGAYGWGGWGGGGTVQGSIARGLGALAVGEGVFNRETAIATSINADTALRWNEYWYDAQMVANHNERIRMNNRMRRDASAGERAYRRTIENPTPDDIANGDALNAALDQMSDPRIHSSALRAANDKIPGKVIRDIPFVNASEAITISLDRLTGEDGWPAALNAPELAEERQAYTRAIDQALEEDKNGEISPQTLAAVSDSLARLRAKFLANRPADPARYNEGLSHLKTLYGMTRMLDRPDVEKIIAELETTKETTLGSLLGFMHTFNLRFGRATTPAQKAAYEQIFPLLDAHRDRVLAAAAPSREKDRGTGKDRDADKDSDTPDRTPAPAPAPRPRHPADFFQGMHLDHLDRSGTRNR